MTSGESQNIEYKQNWRDEYLKWICGFANAQGGTIFIGVNDDGSICGVDNAKKLMEDIPNKVRDVLGIYDDKLMIWNAASLPIGWTVETLMNKHSSQPYNPEIASVFFRAGEIEAWGRGIERIVTACKVYGAEVLEWSFDGTGIWVVFKIPTESVGGTVSGIAGDQVSGTAGGQKDTDHLNTTQAPPKHHPSENFTFNIG